MTRENRTGILAGWGIRFWASTYPVNWLASYCALAQKRRPIALIRSGETLLTA
jgi:hypothetical protein